jgi:hypothetical protein
MVASGMVLHVIEGQECITSSLAEQKSIMAVVYVIQVMARHGVGSQGWRTVRRASGEPYCFQTHAAALTVLREHFSALREERDVRVHAIAQEPESLMNLAAPPAPVASSAPQRSCQSREPCP